ncbi:YlxR family protein [Sandaracinus amylolyticus]|uniref:YlxR family protein n=1 Tax=Sandaracinus amylolyticus TaxID=927083 RepID=UPI001F43F81C|nr:YlxR family protein [Sandaracinus amylolyticus]UJR81138.1 Putative nucleic-acid-binding protein [Sandaracinus amylolyticus]
MLMVDEQQRRGRGTDEAEVDGDDAGEASSRAVSERLCAGCRRTVPREELLRFAIGPEAPYLAPDPQRKLGGRGVSVHPSRKCIELAAKKGGFARALKKGVSIDANALCESAAVLYVMRAESLLIAAARRKKLAIGTDAVRDALRRPERSGGTAEFAGSRTDRREECEVELLVVAADAEGRREELRAAAEKLGRRCTVLGTKGSLGRLFGRDEVGVLGILDRGIADEVVRCAARAAELESPERIGDRGRGGASVRVSEGEGE